MTVGFTGVLFGTMMTDSILLFKGMFLLPGFSVIGLKGFYLIILQFNKLFTVCDAAFGNVGTKLAAKHTVQFTGGQVGIVLQHGIYKLVHTVQAFLL